MNFALRQLLATGILLGFSTVNADGRIAARLIRLPESVRNVFVAETTTAQFHHFEHIDDGIAYRGSRYMSIGEHGDGKSRSGDRRTPLGIYNVTEQLDTSRMHEKYGVTAFPLDYPNLWDRRLQRSGDGIWVHGVDQASGKRPVLDTDGCIALPNEDLSELAVLFEANITPVIVVRQIDWTPAPNHEQIQRELEDAVANWASSLAVGDMHTYLSLYDDDFEHWQMNKKEWSSFSVQTFGRTAIDNVDIDDLLLLRYPDPIELYLSRFRQTVVEGSRTTTIYKRLLWRRAAGGALKIIAEDSG